MSSIKTEEIKNQKEVDDEIQSLRTRIDEILFYQWDPIRISGANSPRDEYTSYVAQVLKIALESTSHQPLAKYLTQLSKEIIERPDSKERAQTVAGLIFSIVHDQEYYPDHKVVTVD